MVFSDTSTKLGLIQRIEYWTNLGDGTISGDTTTLQQFTAAINDAFDEIMPLVLGYTDRGRWDDLNNTDYPIATFDIVAGQNDYSCKVDQDSLDILRIFDVRILTSSNTTEYTTLAKMELDDHRALDAMSPNPSQSGIPDSWLERDNTVFLLPNPNYSATAGAKIFFERIHEYFAYTDTTKTPGIPRQFHQLLAIITARDWMTINKPASVVAIGTLNNKIAMMEQQLYDSASARNPVHARMTVNTNPDQSRRRQADSNR